ncbi:diphosphomevalonate decarboxylase [Labilibacter marinus]|uniref:diphosphomevalonate decarboxylase n=1 Tax=Labilibacter marinus TaxID=1477105 RepID=UPI00094F90ED|nr:diphosphomevalonate decarboxylase [Labilibacter marinus]
MNNKEQTYLSKSGQVNYQSPSNIAIVKYWGKTGIQIPVNPSISFTLKNAVTHTSVAYQYTKGNNTLDFSFAFEGKNNPDFEKKLQVFFDRIMDTLPWLNEYKLQINSENTFPHSSGIASSASSYSALALCLAKVHFQITGEELGINTVSNIARLGSGSACRSVYGGWNTWGTSSLPNSDDEYAINIDDQVHDDFKNIQDSILIVSSDKKSISSTVGHQLMKNHPYQAGRIEQAKQNTNALLDVLKKGNWAKFIEITESEALSLHGLMMSSTPGYTLLHPNSLKIVQLIREFREQKNVNICFTIDAGPNIHVLYPLSNKKEIEEFIENSLAKYCSNNVVINDELGFGPNETGVAGAKS